MERENSVLVKISLNNTYIEVFHWLKFPFNFSVLLHQEKLDMGVRGRNSWEFQTDWPLNKQNVLHWVEVTERFIKSDGWKFCCNWILFELLLVDDDDYVDDMF